MKNAIQETSKDALKELQNGKIEGRRLEVYNCIRKLGKCSNSMIGRELGLSINKITGRVNELRNHFKVVGFAKKDLCPVTNRVVLFWKVVKDIDEFKDSLSRVDTNLNRCFRCGCFVCECEGLK